MVIKLINIKYQQNSLSLKGYSLIELKNNYQKWIKHAEDEIKYCSSRKCVSKGSQGNDQHDF